jgi:hypothetical protein
MLIVHAASARSVAQTEIHAHCRQHSDSPAGLETVSTALQYLSQFQPSAAHSWLYFEMVLQIVL